MNNSELFILGWLTTLCGTGIFTILTGHVSIYLIMFSNNCLILFFYPILKKKIKLYRNTKITYNMNLWGPINYWQIHFFPLLALNWTFQYFLICIFMILGNKTYIYIIREEDHHSLKMNLHSKTFELHFFTWWEELLLMLSVHPYPGLLSVFRKRTYSCCSISPPCTGSKLHL